jgi:putative ABC transport system permease protein
VSDELTTLHCVGDLLSINRLEAIVLSTGGGALGVVFGIAGAAAIAVFAHWPSSVSLSAVLLALAFSAAVGVFFGYWPARKAARLDPISALCFE